MLNFECPKCKTPIQGDDKDAGKSTKCPGCGVAIQFPGKAQAAPDACTADPSVSAPAGAPAGAITTPDKVRAAKKKSDDEDDDDRPRRRDRSDGATATAAGMGVGMIVLICVGVGGCVLLGVGAVLVALLVPAVQKVREAAGRTQTMNNMKQIGMAFHNHHDAMKAFPSQKAPPMNFGARQPELSWRVTILPFIEQGPMFNQINRGLDWDDPINRTFLSRQPMQYMQVLRQDMNNPGQETLFQVFTGPNTLFATPQNSPRLADIRDGTSNTFLFAEAQTAVPWMKPADIAITPNGAIPLPPDRFMVCFADGSVRLLMRRDIADPTLRLFIDPNDGQAVMLP